MSLSLRAVAAGEYADWSAAVLDRLGTLLPAGAPGRAHRDEAPALLARAFPAGLETPGTDVCWLVDDGQVTGYVWLEVADGKCDVRDVRLDRVADAPEVLGLILERAHEHGADALDAWVVTGDPSHESLVAAGKFNVASTNMALSFTSPQPVPDWVQLRPMTRQEYASWSATSVADYAAARARNGESEEVARRTAERQRAELLPDGVGTEGHRFWVAVDYADRVGLLWIDLRTPYGFIYNIEVDEGQRGRGLGRAIMQAGAHAAQQHGREGLGLNVFGDNRTARALYDSLGYVTTQASYRMPLRRTRRAADHRPGRQPTPGQP